MARARRIVVVVFPEVQALDVTGPTEVFSQAERSRPTPTYTIELVAPETGVVRTSSGLQLTADHTLDGSRTQIDTLIVAGGLGVQAAARDERLIRGGRLAAPRSRRGVPRLSPGGPALAAAGPRPARG